MPILKVCTAVFFPLVVIAAINPAYSKGWDGEPSKCVFHQDQGTLRVLLAGYDTTTIFGYSRPSFGKLPNSTRQSFDVYFSGPASKGHDIKWGTVEMGVAPIHSQKSFILVTTPSFLRNLLTQTSVTFRPIGFSENAATIRLDEVPLGLKILDICRTIK